MPGPRVTKTVAAILGVTSLGVTVLGGCTATTTRSEPPPHVVMPGAPGDEPRVASSAELDSIRNSPRPSDVEIDYVAMMIPHHEQALEMSALAPQRAAHPQVRALAERIGGAQGPEIAGMRGWLASHAPNHAETHAGHHPMPGMATEEQLAQLRASTGAEFDRLFLDLMIAHHQGAVTMSTDLLKQGRNEQLHEMAQDVLVSQQDEIGAMQALRVQMGN